MTKITKEEILKLAHISQITLYEDEIEPLLQDLQAVLDYASGLKKIAQLQNKNYISASYNQNVFRSDKVIPTSTQEILAQAPEHEDNYFVVPKILK